MSSPPSSASVPLDARTITVVADTDAPRVDRFLADALPDLSRSRLKELIEQGHLLCDGQVLHAADAPVRQGAKLSLSIPAPVDARPRPQSIPLDILYEDADLIVLDKPSGLVVHPAPGNPDGTLVNALLAHCGVELSGIGGERRPGIVHRLDKDTSGIMVVAKSELALNRLAAAFAARDLERVYLALCWGRPQPDNGEIEGAIGRDPRDRKRMAMVRHGGKPALTRYSVQASWSNAVSLLECRLATGRTHQIRVHLAAIGHPLVGDPVYLKRVPAASRALPPGPCMRLLDFPRQALHATRLAFDHPMTGSRLDFSSRPPLDFQGLLAALDTDAERSPKA